jgi:peptide/nickel transport system permease protein
MSGSVSSTAEAGRELSNVAAEPEADAARRRLPRKVTVGVGIVAVFAIVALLAPVLAPYDPNQPDIPQRLEGPSSAHLLGTDQLGRDVLSRMIFAARVDLPVAVLAVLLPALLGTVLGSLAAYRGGMADAALSGAASVTQAFPIYIFLIALVFALGAGIGSVLIAYTVIGWVVYARLIRGEILRIKGLEYVQAAEAAGIGPWRTLLRHMMPNAIKQTYVYASSDVVLAMIGFATLSYFGLGIQPPTAEWGSMIAGGQDYLRTEPYLSLLPGFAIMTLGTGFALIGDGLDDYLRG